MTVWHVIVEVHFHKRWSQQCYKRIHSYTCTEVSGFIVLTIFTT